MKKRICSKEFFIPIGILIFSYTISIAFSGMFYLTNDDTAIQNALSGVTTGTPYPYHRFINAFEGFIISRLYLVIPSVQWWFIYDHTLLVVGFLVINHTIIKFSSDHRIKQIISIILLILFDCIGFIYNICYVSFTVTSGIIGTAAICEIIGNKDLFNEANPKDRKKRIRVIVFAGLFFALSILHREQCGVAILCYILLALFGLLLQHVNRKKILAIVISVFFLCGFTGAVVFTNQRLKEAENGIDYPEFEKVFGSYMDYPHDTYDENPEIYEHVGWTKTIYQLVRNWCFLDEHVNEYSFRYLVQNSRKSIQNSNWSLIQEGWDALHKNSLMTPCEVAWVVFGLLSFLSNAISKRGRNCIFCLLNLLGTIALFFYQLYTGRALYRSIIVILIPSMTISLITFLHMDWDNRKRLICCLSILATMVIIPCCVGTLRITFDPETKEKDLKGIQTEKNVAEYAMNHPDGIYITSTSLSLNRYPQIIYPQQKPSNTIKWGGGSFFTKEFSLRLQNNGLEELDGNSFKEDNVFLISQTKNPKYTTVYKWLKEQYKANDFVLEDQVCEGVYVYSFVFD